MARKRPEPEGSEGVRIALVPATVARAAVRGRGAGIDSVGLLAALVKAWGGQDQFAQDVFAEFQAAAPGTMTRQRLLEMVTRIVVQVTAQEHARPKAAREMSQDELLESAQALLEKLERGRTQGTAAPEVEG
jgi:hypothetical protein